MSIVYPPGGCTINNNDESINPMPEGCPYNQPITKCFYCKCELYESADILNDYTTQQLECLYKKIFKEYDNYCKQREKYKQSKHGKLLRKELIKISALFRTRLHNDYIKKLILTGLLNNEFMANICQAVQNKMNKCIFNYLF